MRNMRQRMGLIAAMMFALMALVMPAMAEEDLSGYSFDELLALQASLEEELLTRPEYVGKALSEGDYVAGKDFPAGTYELTLNPLDEEDDTMRYLVYETEAIREADSNKGIISMPLKDGYLEENGSAVLDLYEGNCLEIHYCGAKLRMRGKLGDMPAEAYELPEGTLVPVGFYTVGEDIPAGTYSVFYNGRATSRCRVFPDMEEAQELFGDEEVEIIVSATNTAGSIYLKEGQVVHVEYNDVIMKKSEGLVFD